MAPIKLEDNIKEEFKNRSITPSDQSWNKLAFRLDKQYKKANSHKIWWAIAAGIAGLAIVSSLFFFGDSQNIQDSLVTTPELEEQLQDQDEFNPIVEATENLPVAGADYLEEAVAESSSNEQVEVVNSNENKTKKNQQETVKKGRIIASISKEESAVVDTIKKEVVVANQLPVNTTTIDPLTAKVDEVVASITALENNNKTITEAEIEALLMAAQRELKTTPLINPNTQKVDATALLMNVEFELERSFRDKVFDALGDGYKKIRTAMADRNN